jgi:hypothetical protein
MLRFAPEYAAQFPAFLDDMERGEVAEAALLKHYGKTPAAVMEDMRRYLKAAQMPTEVVQLKNQQNATPAAVSDLSAADWQAVLEDLRSALGRRQKASAAWTR